MRVMRVGCCSIVSMLMVFPLTTGGPSGWVTGDGFGVTRYPFPFLGSSAQTRSLTNTWPGDGAPEIATPSDLPAASGMARPSASLCTS